MLFIDYIKDRIEHFNCLTEAINEGDFLNVRNDFFRGSLEHDLKDPQKYISDEIRPVTLVYDGESGLVTMYKIEGCGSTIDEHIQTLGYTN